MHTGDMERLADRLRVLLEARREPLRRRLSGAEGETPAVAELGLGLGRAYAAALDDVLSHHFSAVMAILADERPAESSVSGLVLAGVGGYGRGALALGADLDVRLLAHDLERAGRVAEALLYPLWDAGLAVGHQVVTVEDLLGAAREDLPTATSLLDWRRIAGDGALNEELTRRAYDGVFALGELGRFFERLEREVEQRHRRFGGSVYMLEPDLKNGRGALRDLDVAWWAAKARWKVDDFAALVPLGVLLPRQLAAVESARALLWAIRNLLHHRAGRRSDRLSFDLQESIVEVMGYLKPEPSHDSELGNAVERMMSDYYRAARTISRFRELVVARATPTLRRARPVREDLGDGIELFAGEVTVSRSELYDEDPAIAFKLLAAAVDRGVRLRPSARAALVDRCGDDGWTARLRQSSEAAELFVELTTTCAETQLKRGSVMREMHDVGLLLAMIPEFGPVVGRVHHDTYHVYTVDVHSVAAVDRLAELVRGEVVPAEPDGACWVGALAVGLAAQIMRPRVLFFATLLHDVGKAIGRRDHSQRGAEMAHAILGRLGFSAGETAEVARLVENHLSMYLIATRRDLDDPATVQELARLTRDREGLRELYLLTVADLSTTSPTSMTSWKARMLDELFVATDRHLSGSADDALPREERLAEARALCDGEERAFLERFVRAMPDRYVLGQSAPALVAHADMVRKHLASGRAASVALSPSSRPTVVELCVVAADRPGLLASIAAALAGCRLGVHAAQIYSCEIDSQAQRAVALDIFWVHHSSGPEAAVDLLPQLERNLDDVVVGNIGAEELASRGRTAPRVRRHGPRVPAQVLIDDRSSPRHTVVEVITRDRPGLLYQLSSAIFRHGLSIAVAKIATEGTRVVDVFYVSEQNGAKLRLGPRSDKLRRTLLELLEGLDDHAQQTREASAG
jgi:[protein-PII] uridylyltransferase